MKKSFIHPKTFVGMDNDQDMPFSMVIHTCGHATKEMKVDGMLDGDIDKENDTEEEAEVKVYDWE